MLCVRAPVDKQLCICHFKLLNGFACGILMFCVEQYHALRETNRNLEVYMYRIRKTRDGHFLELYFIV